MIPPITGGIPPAPEAHVARTGDQIQQGFHMPSRVPTKEGSSTHRGAQVADVPALFLRSTLRQLAPLLLCAAVAHAWAQPESQTGLAGTPGANGISPGQSGGTGGAGGAASALQQAVGGSGGAGGNGAGGNATLRGGTAGAGGGAAALPLPSQCCRLLLNTA